MLQLVRITARVSKVAQVRLQAECRLRYSTLAQFTTYGAVITDLILSRLPKIEGENDPAVQAAAAAAQAEAIPLSITGNPGSKRGRHKLAKTG